MKKWIMRFGRFLTDRTVTVPAIFLCLSIGAIVGAGFLARHGGPLGPDKLGMGSLWFVLIVDIVALAAQFSFGLAFWQWHLADIWRKGFESSQHTLKSRDAYVLSRQVHESLMEAIKTGKLRMTENGVEGEALVDLSKPPSSRLH